jgi:hypothetical protein
MVEQDESMIVLRPQSLPWSVSVSCPEWQRMIPPFEASLNMAKRFSIFVFRLDNFGLDPSGSQTCPEASVLPPDPRFQPCQRPADPCVLLPPLCHCDQVWDPWAPAILHTMGTHGGLVQYLHVVLSPTGRHLLVSSEWGEQVRVWDLGDAPAPVIMRAAHKT